MIKRGKDDKSYHAVVASHIVAPDLQTLQEIDGNDLEQSNLLLSSRNALPYNVWRKINKTEEVESLQSVKK